MKIVIDIPEEIYNGIKGGLAKGSYDMWLAVTEGETLEECLGKISAEIEEKRASLDYLDPDAYYMADEILAIVEKYKKEGAE